MTLGSQAQSLTMFDGIKMERDFLDSTVCRKMDGLIVRYLRLYIILIPLAGRVTIDHKGIMFTKVLQRDSGMYEVQARNKAGAGKGSGYLRST